MNQMELSFSAKIENESFARQLLVRESVMQLFMVIKMMVKAK